MKLEGCQPFASLPVVGAFALERKRPRLWGRVGDEGLQIRLIKIRTVDVASKRPDVVSEYPDRPSLPCQTRTPVRPAPHFPAPSSSSVPVGSRKIGRAAGVLVWQGSGWSVGILANHIWSFCWRHGSSGFSIKRILQPFIAYTTHRRGRLRSRAKAPTTGRLANGSFQLYGCQDCRDRAAASCSITAGVRLGPSLRYRSPWIWLGGFGMTFSFSDAVDGAKLNNLKIIRSRLKPAEHPKSNAGDVDISRTTRRRLDWHALPRFQHWDTTSAQAAVAPLTSSVMS